MDIIKVFLTFGSICCVVIAHPQPYNDNISGSKSKTCASMVSAFPPDRNTECCGLMNEDLVRITSGHLLINPHQYPWLALIEYTKSGVMTTLCNGALISGKYVLTAAQCVTGFTLDGAEPKIIILGEFDELHKADDCIAVNDESKECTDGVTRIPIEKTIPHPDYDAEHEDRKSDIALIRMTQIAPYTDFIQPICLPSEDITLQTGFIYLKKTSWVLSDGGKKKQVTLPFISQDKCQSSLNSLKLKMWKDQICIGGQRKEHSCGSDDGAPLVYENGKMYEAIGILSSSKGCLWNIPTTYTKVYEYCSWIKSTITA